MDSLKKTIESLAVRTNYGLSMEDLKNEALPAPLSSIPTVSFPPPCLASPSYLDYQVSMANLANTPLAGSSMVGLGSPKSRLVIP